MPRPDAQALLKHMPKQCIAIFDLAMHVRTYALTESYSPLCFSLALSNARRGA